MFNVIQSEMIARQRHREMERSLRSQALHAEGMRARAPQQSTANRRDTIRLSRYVASLALLLIALVTLAGCGAAGAPYGIDKRPLPAGDDLEVLLPRTVGNFSREALAPGTQPSADSDLSVIYSNGDAEISMGFSLTEDVADARSAIATTREEAIASAVNIDAEQLSLDAEPAYFKVENFISWSRGPYFYYAHADDPAALDHFMQAFPY